MPDLDRWIATLRSSHDRLSTLLARLDQRGLRDKTVIVFTSASGFLLGRHGLWSDGLASDPLNMYEEVMVTPLIWNWPGMVPVAGARPELVSVCDFLPTVCQLAGAAPPRDRNLPGRSYLPAVLNEPFPKKEPWRNLILRDQGKGPGELFDLRADPREKINQYGNPSFLTLRESLTAELDAWRKRYA